MRQLAEPDAAARRAATIEFALYDAEEPASFAAAGLESDHVLVVTDPLLLPPAKLVTRLRELLVHTSSVVAALPVSNEAENRDAAARAAAPYLTLRELQQMTAEMQSTRRGCRGREVGWIAIRPPISAAPRWLEDDRRSSAACAGRPRSRHLPCRLRPSLELAARTDAHRSAGAHLPRREVHPRVRLRRSAPRRGAEAAAEVPRGRHRDRSARGGRRPQADRRRLLRRCARDRRRSSTRNSTGSSAATSSSTSTSRGRSWPTCARSARRAGICCSASPTSPTPRWSAI